MHSFYHHDAVNTLQLSYPTVDFTTSLCRPGIDGPLVDTEGFPLADPSFDIYQIRKDRQRLHELRNDHKVIMLKLGNALGDLHRETARERREDKGQQCHNSSAASPPASSTLAEPMALDDNARRVGLGIEGVLANGNGTVSGPSTPTPAFAVIDEVAANSPAEAAGLRVGDQVVTFASITCPGGAQATALALREIASVLPSLEGRGVEIVIRRSSEGENELNSALLSLHLTPRQWGGRGLLGCHLTPLT